MHREAECHRRLRARPSCVSVHSILSLFPCARPTRTRALLCSTALASHCPPDAARSSATAIRGNAAHSDVRERHTRREGAHTGQRSAFRADSRRASLRSLVPLRVVCVCLVSDMKQSVVVSGHELNHYYRLASVDDFVSNEAAARKAAMHATSQARYQNWGNTLEAQRTKKKNDRIRKLEAIERAQQIIDAEEAQYQEAQRRVVLDRANRLLWQDTGTRAAARGSCCNCCC